jgi:hypothetical protein
MLNDTKEEARRIFLLGVHDTGYKSYSCEFSLTIQNHGTPSSTSGNAEGLLHITQLTKEEEVDHHVEFISRLFDNFLTAARELNSSPIECSFTGRILLYKSVVQEPVRSDSDLANDVLSSIGTSSEKVVGIEVDQEGRFDLLRQATIVRRISTP